MALRLRLFIQVEVDSQIISLKILDNRIRASKRRDWKRFMLQTESSLEAAWENRDLSKAWAHARALSGSKIGPKMRLYASPPTEQISSGQWAEHLQKTPTRGGCSSSSVDFCAEWKQRMCAESFGSYPFNDLVDGHDDTVAVLDFIRHAKLRKSGPCWALPIEVWRLLLCDRSKFCSKPKQKTGIGARVRAPPVEPLKDALSILHSCIRRTCCTPLLFDAAGTAKISKNNSKAGCDGQRIIALFDDYSKCYYKRQWQCLHEQPRMDWAYGYAKKQEKGDGHHVPTLFVI